VNYTECAAPSRKTISNSPFPGNFGLFKRTRPQLTAAALAGEMPEFIETEDGTSRPRSQEKRASEMARAQAALDGCP
jgi:hypothetical protein